MTAHDTQAHDAHAHDAHAHDSHGHAHEDPAEARDVIADFGFYAAFLIAGAAILLQGFTGAYGAPPRPAPGAEPQVHAHAGH